jgi:hypothetical protein
VSVNSIQKSSGIVFRDESTRCRLLDVSSESVDDFLEKLNRSRVANDVFKTTQETTLVQPQEFQNFKLDLDKGILSNKNIIIITPLIFGLISGFRIDFANAHMQWSLKSNGVRTFRGFRKTVCLNNFGWIYVFVKKLYEVLIL